MKVLYKHIKSGDLFAIETDGGGDVVLSAGLLLWGDFDAVNLDYDK